MPQTLEISYRLVVVRVLKHGNIRQELVMQSWFLKRLDGTQPLVQHVPDVLNGSGDDS